MDNITHRIAESIRANDLPAYQRERYPAIQEGETVRFTDEDFHGIDFDQFVMGFFVFQNCNLDDAKHIYGQEDCDFRGMKYDRETQFVYGSGKLAARSRFINCKLDDETRDFLSQQGVEIS